MIKIERSFRVFKGFELLLKYNTRTLSENIKFICMSIRNRQKNECKLILNLTTMYVYCVYPAISKGPKQLPNCLKIAQTIVVLNVFKDVSAYTVTVSLLLNRNRVPEKLYIGQSPLITKLIQSMQFDCSNRTSAGYNSYKQLKTR